MVATFVPYQFAFVVAVLVHIVSCVRSLLVAQALVSALVPLLFMLGVIRLLQQASNAYCFHPCQCVIFLVDIQSTGSMGPPPLFDVYFRHVLFVAAMHAASADGLDQELVRAVVRTFLVRPSSGLYCTVHLFR